MVYIYEVQMSGEGKHHEHIEAVRWKDPDRGKGGEWSREEAIEWIDDGGKAYVCGDHAHIARVHVVRPENSDPYIRTRRDDNWSDNLLTLDRY